MRQDRSDVALLDTCPGTHPQVPLALCTRAARRYAAGMEIMRQGENAFEVFLIAEGSVKVSHTFPDGRSTILRLAESGTVLGASTALLEVPHANSVVTVSPCRLHAIAADVFRMAVENDPVVSKYLLLQDANELHELGRHVVAVNCLTARERLTAILTRTSTAGEGSGRTYAASRQLRDWELAQLIGVTPQYLSLLVHDLEGEHVLERDGNFWRLATPPVLPFESDEMLAHWEYISGT